MAQKGDLRTGRGQPTLDLLLLTFAAGTMDALSYIQTGVFTANMTGNAVVLGLSIAGGERSRAVSGAVAIASFAIGASLGALLCLRWKPNRSRREDLKLGSAMELPFLLAFACLYFIFPSSPGGASLALTGTAACALGIQSVAVRRLRISGVVTTFITGTLTTAVVKLVAHGAGSLDDEAPGSPSILLSMFAIYIFAAAMAAGLERAHIAGVALVPLLLVAAVGIRSRAAV
jgi:uncharacterized membrane protein YoaK (UPF0700 family)